MENQVEAAEDGKRSRRAQKAQRMLNRGGSSAMGERCAFCGLKYRRENITEYSMVGSGTQCMKRTKSKNTELHGKKSTDLARSVANFGYTCTDRALVDSLVRMTSRGINLGQCVGANLRQTYVNLTCSGKSGAASSVLAEQPRLLCRLCFELQNAERSVHALGTQFAASLGVPRKPKSWDRKVASKMIGPARAAVMENPGDAPPHVYVPHSTCRGGKDQKRLHLPKGSLKAKTMRWSSCSLIPKDAFVYRIIIMIHELHGLPFQLNNYK